MAVAKERPPPRVQSFSVLPLSIAATPAYPHASTHELYLQPHTPKTATPDSSRSLFAANVPIDCTEKQLRHLFGDVLKAAGRVSHVDFSQFSSRPAPLATSSSLGKKRKRTAPSQEVSLDALQPMLPSTWDRRVHPSGASAVIVFTDRAAAGAALKAVDKAIASHKKIVWPVPSMAAAGDGELGSARYAAHAALAYPDPEELQALVDEFMQEYEELEVESRESRDAARGVPDEDGFVTVTRGGRAGPAREQEAKEALERLKKRQEDKAREMDGFYRFQGRERRKQEAAKRVERFREEQAKVIEMRKQRGAPM